MYYPLHDGSLGKGKEIRGLLFFLWRILRLSAFSTVSTFLTWPSGPSEEVHQLSPPPRDQFRNFPLPFPRVTSERFYKYIGGGRRSALLYCVPCRQVRRPGERGGPSLRRRHRDGGGPVQHANWRGFEGGETRKRPLVSALLTDSMFNM